MTDKVDLFYDLFDQAAIIHYEKLKLDYYSSLLAVTRGLIFGDFHSKLADEAIHKLEEIYSIINSEDFLNEEVRLAVELLIIKAFKHIDFDLSLMTPDTINYLFCTAVNKIFRGREIIILDTAVGTGNLINAINNNYEGVAHLIGIEHNKFLVELASAGANLQNNELKIYYQDARDEILDEVDLVIGDLDPIDLDAEEGEYFPYQNILSNLGNLADGGYFIYVIENDFFSQAKNKEFKEKLEEVATILSLVVLPKAIFKDGHIGRSILIGKKEVLDSYDLEILEIPSLDKISLEKSLDNFIKMIEKI